MKKFFASVGLAAAGTASLHAAYAPDMTPGESKAWEISAGLSGFYDDNYTTTPQKQGSFGFEVNPSFELNMPLQQTEIGVKYSYGLYYYQQRETDGQNPVDQSHQFDLWVDHAFNSLWEVRVQDTVTVAQEPELLTPGAASVPQRVEGNNLYNTATITVNTTWSRLFSTSFSYVNTFVSYENSGATVTPPLGPPYAFPPPPGTPAAGSVSTSYAGTLDQIDQSFGPEFQWHVQEETMLSVGYKFGLVNYTGNEPIAVVVTSPTTYSIYMSDSRDNWSHTGYVGIQHQFLANLMFTAQAGVQYVDYYNDPQSQHSWGPYGNASLVYTYAAGSYAQLGFMQTRNATDTVNVNSNGQITQDQESSVVYASINHPITAKLTASLVGHFQYSVYNQGQYDAQSSEFYNGGLTLTYALTRHFSANAAYNIDYYTTPVPGQNYSRNRVYLGITASY